jgi:N-acyl-D-amino-acid deacylase
MRPVILFILAFILHDVHAQFDIIIRNGMIYDGSGSQPFRADIGIKADTIAAIGDLSSAQAKETIDALAQAVAPGFINMLSWADGALLKDGRSLSDIKQGVTLEVFGEGWSPGPRKKANAKDTLWTTLGGYFKTLERKGVSTNFASFVGATTVRNLVLGYNNRHPTAAELQKMKALVEQALQEGAMGLGSSLIYAPAAFADTRELIELCRVVARYNGMYITHMRSESDKIPEAINEVFQIAHGANLPVEIYHLKINNTWNWDKIDQVIFKIDSARKAGLKITANMYPYAASGTTLTARLPAWVQEGGAKAMRSRFKNPVLRKRLLEEMKAGIPARNSDPNEVMLLQFNKDSLNKLYRGKRLDEVARLHGKSADETVLDLVYADRSGVAAIYFLISEENLRRMLALPYVSICSDAASIAAEKPFSDEAVHPRAYGSFARFLSKYVRDENVVSLPEAIRRMTSLPAANLKIKKRGSLKVGNYADIVIFDPLTIKDNATYEKPHQYSEGVQFVLVNGVAVLRDGEHTGATPGRCVRGPGWMGK